MHPVVKRLLSRKFIAGTGTAALLVVCWVASNWLPVAAAGFAALATGLVTLFTSYAGGNVMHHWAYRNAANPDPDTKGNENLQE